MQELNTTKKKVCEHELSHYDTMECGYLDGAYNWHDTTKLVAVCDDCYEVLYEITEDDIPEDDFEDDNE